MKLKFIKSNVFISASIGNILEFYDFATYGFLMPVMAPLFFPSSNPITSLLLAFGVFAVSFIVRPLGGIIFGYMGDIYGRKIAFSLSLIFMAATTTIIGLLPTYEVAGIIAPCVLILCRLVQGICLGGEFSGSLIYASEHARQREHNSAFVTASVTAAGVSGWFLSSLVCSSALNLELAFSSWRIPFLLGSFVGIVGYYIRRSLPESPVLLSNSSNIWQIAKSERYTMMSIASIGVLMGGLFYGLHIFPNSYLPTNYFYISKVTALHCTSVGIGAYMVLLPPMGLIADKIGHIKHMKIFSFLTVLLSYPIIYLMMSGQIGYILISEIMGSFILAGFMASATFVMTLHFLPSVRYRLVSLSYNIGASLIGGFTPGIFLFLIEHYHSASGLAIFLLLCGLAGFVASYHFGRILSNQESLYHESDWKRLAS